MFNCIVLWKYGFVDKDTNCHYNTILHKLPRDSCCIFTAQTHDSCFNKCRLLWQIDTEIAITNRNEKTAVITSFRASFGSGCALARV